MEFFEYTEVTSSCLRQFLLVGYVMIFRPIVAMNPFGIDTSRYPLTCRPILYNRILGLAY